MLQIKEGLQRTGIRPLLEKVEKKNIMVPDGQNWPDSGVCGQIQKITRKFNQKRKGGFRQSPLLVFLSSNTLQATP
jgi:hypothetical protein